MVKDMGGTLYTAQDSTEFYGVVDKYHSCDQRWISRRDRKNRSLYKHTRHYWHFKLSCLPEAGYTLSWSPKLAVVSPPPLELTEKMLAYVFKFSDQRTKFENYVGQLLTQHTEEGYHTDYTVNCYQSNRDCSDVRV